MSWDPADFARRLTEAVTRLDRPETVRLVNALIARIDGGAGLDERAVRGILSTLRGKRFFDLMERVAEALLLADQDHPVIRRQYGQSLIDQGKLAPARSALEAMVAQPDLDPAERAEALGLLGRIHKQLYVNAADPASRKCQAHLRKAVAAYAGVYLSNPERYSWHGINAVALVWRARRDLVDVGDTLDPATAARDILARISARPASAWDLATATEASLALGQHEEALRLARAYVKDPAADAFELASTLRQLREVWLLTAGAPPGASLLPLLESHLLERSGGRVDLAGREVGEAIESVRSLEKVLGQEGAVSLAWFRTGLERCQAVAQIRTASDEGFGTGFLIRGADLVPGLGDTAFLLTNAHVVSDQPGVPDALPPDEAVVVFEALSAGAPQRYRVRTLLWTSPPDELDATLLALDDLPQGPAPFTIHPRLPARDGTQKVYIIGHPGGRGLAFSLHDNLLLDADARVLHYRAPTEGGSSGSPVFNAQWGLIGLHHAGSLEMARLNGQSGTYAANEGILLSQIRERIRADGLRP